MPCTMAITRAHNNAVLSKAVENKHATPKECNCQKKENCSLSGMCVSECVVYQATVTTEDDWPNESYVGLTEGTLKSRYLYHTSSFRNERTKKRD